MLAVSQETTPLEPYVCGLWGDGDRRRARRMGSMTTMLPQLGMCVREQRAPGMRSGFKELQCVSPGCHMRYVHNEGPYTFPHTTHDTRPSIPPDLRAHEARMSELADLGLCGLSCSKHTHSGVGVSVTNTNKATKASAEYCNTICTGLHRARATLWPCPPKGEG